MLRAGLDTGFRLISLTEQPVERKRWLDLRLRALHAICHRLRVHPRRRSTGKSNAMLVTAQDRR